MGHLVTLPLCPPLHTPLPSPPPISSKWSQHLRIAGSGCRWGSQAEDSQLMASNIPGSTERGSSHCLGSFFSSRALVLHARRPDVGCWDKILRETTASLYCPTFPTDPSIISWTGHKTPRVQKCLFPSWFSGNTFFKDFFWGGGREGPFVCLALTFLNEKLTHFNSSANQGFFG